MNKRTIKDTLDDAEAALRSSGHAQIAEEIAAFNSSQARTNRVCSGFLSIGVVAAGLAAALVGGVRYGAWELVVGAAVMIVTLALIGIVINQEIDAFEDKINATRGEPQAPA